MESTLTVFHPLPPGEVLAAFVADPTSWLPTGARPDGPRRWRVELSAGPFTRPVALSVGDPWGLGGDRWRTLAFEPLPIDADPVPVEHLLPDFEGQLGLVGTGGKAPSLVLTGVVRTPFGSAGALLDRLLLHRVGERTLRRLLEQVVEQLGARTAAA